MNEIEKGIKGCLDEINKLRKENEELREKWNYKKWAKTTCSQCQKYWTDDRKGCQTCDECIWIREGKTNYKSGFIKIEKE